MRNGVQTLPATCGRPPTLLLINLRLFCHFLSMLEILVAGLLVEDVLVSEVPHITIKVGPTPRFDILTYLDPGGL